MGTIPVLKPTYPFWRVRTGPGNAPPGGRGVPAQGAASAPEGFAARTRLSTGNTALLMAQTVNALDGRHSHVQGCRQATQHS